MSSAPSESSAQSPPSPSPVSSTSVPTQPNVNVVPGAPPPPSSFPPKGKHEQKYIWIALPVGVYASPLAKATAFELGVSISGVEGMVESVTES